MVRMRMCSIEKQKSNTVSYSLDLPSVNEEKCEELLLSSRHGAKSCGGCSRKHNDRALHFELCLGDELEQKAREKSVVQQL